MRLPDFIIIGVAKCGTSTLYQYLCRHPQVFMSNPKEPEFFASRNDENYAKGIDWYASLFSGAKPHQVCGEASGKYTNWPKFPESAARIAQVLPQVKLIYIMRHPIKRAYSQYVQNIKYHQVMGHQLKVVETFEENIKRDSYVLDVSDYMKQIEQYLRFFPRESFLFLFMDDLAQKPTDTMRKICRFINVDEGFDFIQDGLIAANVGSRHIGGFLRSQMTAPLRSIPGMARIAALLPQSVRDSVYKGLRKLPYYEKSLKQQYIPKPMCPKTYHKLLERFREPNQKLAEFLHCDLSSWSK